MLNYILICIAALSCLGAIVSGIWLHNHKDWKNPELLKREREVV